MRAIGYVRVSTEDQAREGVSLDNQESKIKSCWKVRISRSAVFGVFAEMGAAWVEVDSALPGSNSSLDEVSGVR